MQNEVLKWPLSISFLETQYAKDRIELYLPKDLRISFGQLQMVDESQASYLKIMMRYFKFYIDEMKRYSWFSIEYVELSHLFEVLHTFNELTEDIVNQIHRLLRYSTTAIKCRTIQTIVTGIVRENPQVITDKAMVLLAVRKQPSIMKQLEFYWKDDEDIVEAAVVQNKIMISYASKRCQAMNHIANIAWKQLPNTTKEWNNNKCK
jgi:hypothetical protein